MASFDQPSRREFIGMTACGLSGVLAPRPAPDTIAAVPAVAAQAPSSGPSGALDLRSLTITRAAEQIRRRTLSPVDLMRATLDRIAAVDPKVGAFITVTGDSAMDTARAAEQDIRAGRYRGPLHGIPFGVKDTYYTRGVRTTAASPVLEDFIPEFDCTIVARLKEAGAILTGKLNLPEFSFGGFTPGCHNPWDLTRNAGGSSGGPGAALAASLLIAATGGDTSGSIRNPASTNGVVGHKPTFGLVSRYGVVPISWTLDHLGPMARTVEDVAILLKAMAGHDPRDRFSARVAVPDYPSLLHRTMRGLRVGVCAEKEIERFHPDTRQAFFAAVKVVEGLGATLREVTFSDRMKLAGTTQGIIRISEAAAYHRDYLRTRADRYKSDVGQTGGSEVSRVRTTVEAGSLITAAQYQKCQRARTIFLEETQRLYEPIDVLLTPTMPAPAGETVTAPETYRDWWNLSGYPAISLPCGFSTSPAGLPLGLQVSGKPFEDALVLAVAHQYEAATDWHTRRPSL
jgi:aspartyl-tRNA(Asn)/glutamyl-tRNA(Gln) amidotransferase subunit A